MALAAQDPVRNWLSTVLLDAQCRAAAPDLLASLDQAPPPGDAELVLPIERRDAWSVAQPFAALAAPLLWREQKAFFAPLWCHLPKRDCSLRMPV